MTGVSNGWYIWKRTLTFMFPRRLVLSTTSNFLMRSLFAGKRQKEDASWYGPKQTQHVNHNKICPPRYVSGERINFHFASTFSLNCFFIHRYSFPNNLWKAGLATRSNRAKGKRFIKSLCRKRAFQENMRKNYVPAPSIAIFHLKYTHEAVLAKEKTSAFTKMNGHALP